MAYFNGTFHGWNERNGFVPPEPMTRWYCDTCAETAIPLPPKKGTDEDGRRHHKTGFKWAYWRVGAPCQQCGKDI